MGNNKRGTPRQQRIQRPLHRPLTRNVQGGGGLIKNHHIRVRQKHARKRHQLPLTRRQVRPGAAQHRLVPLRKGTNKLVRAHRLRRRNNLLIGGVRVTQTNVPSDRVRKQEHLLSEHHHFLP